MEGGAFSAEVVQGVSTFAPDDWEALFPGQAEGHDYYAACETLACGAYRLMAVGVWRDGLLVAAAPVFSLVFDLTAPVQGRWRPWADRLGRLAPRLTRLKVLGLGSPLAEQCHLGFHPCLGEEGRRQAMAAMLAALERHARAEGVGLVALKDVTAQDDAALAATLAGCGYARMASLPVAVLDVPADMERYLATLSPSTRKDVRRKLRGRSALRIEQRTEIGDIHEEIAALYEETRSNSDLDYGDLERLPAGYFRAVMQGTGSRARMMLYYVEDRLLAFNLLFVEKDRVIDKFLGMRYPQARHHNLYVVSWMENVMLAQAAGCSLLQSGQTAYAAKLRLGSRLAPSFLYFRHRNPVLNRLLRLLSCFLAFDRQDPELRALAREGRA